MWWMWLLALVFLQDLDWSWFYDNFGFWGLFFSYIIIGWGEVGLYSYLIYRVMKSKGAFDDECKVSKM